jgi:hypothetical protein
MAVGAEEPRLQIDPELTVTRLDTRLDTDYMVVCETIAKDAS